MSVLFSAAVFGDTQPGAHDAALLLTTNLPRERYRRRTLAMVAAIVMVGFMVVSTLLTIYFLFFEPPWLSYHNLPFPIVTPQVTQGGPVAMTVVRCNTRRGRHDYEITRSLIPENGDPPVILPSTRVSIEPGCTTETSRANITLADMKPGFYYPAGTARAEGTLRVHIVPWRGGRFEVVAKPSPATEIIVIKGEPGEPGKTGKSGATGATGPAGATGATGAKGTFWGNK